MAKASRRSSEKRRSFNYQRRDVDAVKRRANQRGGRFDSLFIEGVTTFTPHDGDNFLRILPPGWADAEHFGFDIFVHYGIGSDDQAYLCPNKMKNEPCPICEERRRLEDIGDATEEELRALTATKRCAMYVIDREAEKEGVQLWSAPWTVDRDIGNICINKKTGEVYMVDDPDDGFDIEFNKTGKQLRTKYTAFQIDRDSSPIKEDQDEQDEVLNFIMDSPIPDILNFYDYDYIKKVFNGGAPEPTVEDDEPPFDKDDEKPARRSRSRRDEEEQEEEEAPKRGRGRSRDEEPEEEDEKPARRARRGRDEEPEEEDEKPARRRSRRDEEEEPEEEEKPRRRSSRDEDPEEEDEKPSRRRGRDRDEEPEEDEKPRSRRGRDRDEEPEEEDEKPARRRASRDEEEEPEEEEPKGGRSRLNNLRRRNRDR